MTARHELGHCAVEQVSGDRDPRRRRPDAAGGRPRPLRTFRRTAVPGKYAALIRRFGRESRSEVDDPAGHGPCIHELEDTQSGVAASKVIFGGRDLSRAPAPRLIAFQDSRLSS